MLRKQVLGAILPLMLCPGLSEATGLTVTVSEASERLPRTEVILVNAATGVVQSQNYTDDQGTITFDVKSGRYRIGAFRPKYTGVWKKGVTVADKDVAVSIELEPRAFSEEDEEEEDCE